MSYGKTSDSFGPDRRDESDFDQQNPYAAPSPLGKTEGLEFDQLEPTDGKIRLGHLNAAFKIASDRQGVWILSLLAVGLPAFVLNVVLGILQQVVDAQLAQLGSSTVSLAISQLVTIPFSCVVAAFVNAAYFSLACKQLRGEPISVGDAFNIGSSYGAVYITTIVSALISFPMILLIQTIVLPVLEPEANRAISPAEVALVLASFLIAILITARFMLAIPLVVDGRQEGIKALQLSWKATRGIKKSIAAVFFHVSAAFLSGVGAILCGVGILLTAPIYFLAVSLVYRDLFPAKGVQHS